MERDLAAFFARQHGLITRAQAGERDHAIRHRVATGRWVRVAAGVYRLAGVEVTWHQRAMAACLAAGPDAVVSHRAAAVLFEVSGFRPGPIDITVPPGRSARHPFATVHRSPVTQGERTSRLRIPVTRPVRMLHDLAGVVSPATLEEAVDDVLCRRLIRLDRLLSTKPTGALRTILEAWTPGAVPANVREVEVVRALLAAGLGQPARQFRIAEAAATVDLAYPADRIAIELDSFRWHAGRRPFASDRVRGNRIVAAGWHLLRAAPGDVAALVEAVRAVRERAA